MITHNSPWLRDLIGATAEGPGRITVRGSSFPEKLRGVETKGRSAGFDDPALFVGILRIGKSERKRCRDECCAAVRDPGGSLLLMEDERGHNKAARGVF